MQNLEYTKHCELQCSHELVQDGGEVVALPPPAEAPGAADFPGALAQFELLCRRGFRHVFRDSSLMFLQLQAFGSLWLSACSFLRLSLSGQFCQCHGQCQEELGQSAGFTVCVGMAAVKPIVQKKDELLNAGLALYSAAVLQTRLRKRRRTAQLSCSTAQLSCRCASGKVPHPRRRSCRIPSAD